MEDMSSDLAENALNHEPSCQPYFGILKSNCLGLGNGRDRNKHTMSVESGDYDIVR